MCRMKGREEIRKRADFLQAERYPNIYFAAWQKALYDKLGTKQLHAGSPERRGAVAPVTSGIRPRRMALLVDYFMSAAFGMAHGHVGYVMPLECPGGGIPACSRTIRGRVIAVDWTTAFQMA